jgi:hypothetical protein
MLGPVEVGPRAFEGGVVEVYPSCVALVASLPASVRGDWDLILYVRDVGSCSQNCTRGVEVNREAAINCFWGITALCWLFIVLSSDRAPSMGL